MVVGWLSTEINFQSLGMYVVLE